MGKLRAEICKTRVFLKIPGFFSKSWGKKVLFRFQPKIKWVKGAIGILYIYTCMHTYVYTYICIHIHIQCVSICVASWRFWDRSRTGAPGAVLWTCGADGAAGTTGTRGVTRRR